MKKMREFKKRIVQKTDLAPEAVGCMRLTIIDNNYLYLENHQGVHEYTQKRILIDGGAYGLVVKGSRLMLESFGKDNVAVRGEIDTIQYEKNG